MMFSLSRVFKILGLIILFFVLGGIENVLARTTGPCVKLAQQFAKDVENMDLNSLAMLRTCVHKELKKRTSFSSQSSSSPAFSKTPQLTNEDYSRLGIKETSGKFYYMRNDNEEKEVVYKGTRILTDSDYRRMGIMESAGKWS